MFEFEFEIVGSSQAVWVTIVGDAYPFFDGDVVILIVRLCEGGDDAYNEPAFVDARLTADQVEHLKEECYEEIDSQRKFDRNLPIHPEGA